MNTLNITDMQAQVKEFMQKAGQECPTSPVMPGYGTTCKLRVHLIREELDELESAFYKGNLTEAYDAILDLLVVVIGTGVACGLDLRQGWEEVHRSNMSKFQAGWSIRADGKMLKSPHWTPPQLAEIVEKQKERV